MDDVAALNTRVEALEALLANHESRLPPEPKFDDPNRAYSHQLSYWVRAICPPTANTYNSGLLGYDGPHDRTTATARAQALAMEKAKYYEPTTKEPWPVRSVSWRDDWTKATDTGVILIIEILEANGRIVTTGISITNYPTISSKRRLTDGYTGT
jgi:hypothetical protein